MGYYINPFGQTKTDWLGKHGVPVIGTPPLPSELLETQKLICSRVGQEHEMKKVFETLIISQNIRTECYSIKEHSCLFQ